MLHDLITSRGDKGKWFAAAKDAGFLDLALDCATHPGADPSTLIRAARDFSAKDSSFAATVALLAISNLLAGGGYDPTITGMDDAVGYLMAAAVRAGATEWASRELGKLVERSCRLDREASTRPQGGDTTPR